HWDFDVWRRLVAHYDPSLAGEPCRRLMGLEQRTHPLPDLLAALVGVVGGMADDLRVGPEFVRSVSTGVEHDPGRPPHDLLRRRQSQCCLSALRSVPHRALEPAVGYRAG